MLKEYVSTPLLDKSCNCDVGVTFEKSADKLIFGFPFLGPYLELEATIGLRALLPRHNNKL